MTTTPSPTAEQVVADALEGVLLTHRRELDEPQRADVGRIAAAALRAHGLLSEGAPRGLAFYEAAKAERATHEARGWTAEHDREHGPSHPLRLALGYLANGEPVKAGALIYAALDVLSEGAPSISPDNVGESALGLHSEGTPIEQAQIERAARELFEDPLSLGDYTWDEMVVEDPSRADLWREDARRILAAAGVAPQGATAVGGTPALPTETPESGNVGRGFGESATVAATPKAGKGLDPEKVAEVLYVAGVSTDADDNLVYCEGVARALCEAYKEGKLT